MAGIPKPAIENIQNPKFPADFFFKRQESIFFVEDIIKNCLFYFLCVIGIFNFHCADVA